LDKPLEPLYRAKIECIAVADISSVPIILNGFMQCRFKDYKCTENIPTLILVYSKGVYCCKISGKGTAMKLEQLIDFIHKNIAVKLND